MFTYEVAPLPQQIKMDEKTMEEYKKKFENLRNVELPDDDDDI